MRQRLKIKIAKFVRSIHFLQEANATSQKSINIAVRRRGTRPCAPTVRASIIGIGICCKVFITMCCVKTVTDNLNGQTS